MCSSYSVIWKFIEAQAKKKKKICSRKSSSRRQLGLAAVAWDSARLTGAWFSLSVAEQLTEHKCWETWIEKSKSKFSYFGIVNVKNNTLL